MAAPQFLLIRLGDSRQRNAEHMGRDCEAPEGVSELLGEPFLIDHALLKNALSDEAEQLGGFLDETNARVNKPVLLVE
jgi:hypothetical protein